jgi:hypothetical protein
VEGRLNAIAASHTPPWLFRMGDFVIGVFPEGEGAINVGVPQLLDIADQDDVTVHSPAYQNQLFAVARPSEIKD